MRRRVRGTNATPPCPGPPVRATSTPLGASALSAAATCRSTCPGVRPAWSSGTASDEHVKCGAAGHGCEPASRGGRAGATAVVVRAVVLWTALLPPPPHAVIANARAMTTARRMSVQSRIAGNSTTSRIVRLPVSSITSRSIPMPIPPAGASPCSSACR